MNASAPPSSALPLSVLLSQAWAAFTIEFDNDFEHRTPHRTTNHGSTGSGAAPWLVSMAMWTKFLRFIPDAGITVREFQRLAALTNKEMKLWLTRISQWWGYVVIDKNGGQDPFNWLVRPTSGGQKALKVWRPLTGIIEKRWQERFGKTTLDELCESMQSPVRQFSPELPDCLPILGYEMLSTGADPQQRDEGTSASASECTLPVLLSKVLLAFAIQYERDSRLSLAISANVLRLAKEEGTRFRDLPRLSGVSKEAIAMAVKRLEERGFGVVQAETQGSRVKALVLTAKGRQARDI